MTPQHLAFTILTDIGSHDELLRCETFAALHEHCDANTLGDLESADMETRNAAIALVDEWLTARPQTATDIVVLWDSQDPDDDPTVWVPPHLSHFRSVCFDKNRETAGRGDNLDTHFHALIREGCCDNFSDYTQLP